MKSWRFAGFDDSFKEDECYIIGAVFQGNSYLEGVMADRIEVDGLDSTAKIISMVRRSKFRNQIRAIFLDGITFGGFNVADIAEISESVNIPVIAVTRKKPDFESIYRALENVPEPEIRKSIIGRSGKIHSHGDVFFQFSGCDAETAVEMIGASTLKGNMPECLRVAHMIATAIVHGESRGKV